MICNQLVIGSIPVKGSMNIDTNTQESLMCLALLKMMESEKMMTKAEYVRIKMKTTSKKDLCEALYAVEYENAEGAKVETKAVAAAPEKKNAKKKGRRKKEE